MAVVTRNGAMYLVVDDELRAAIAAPSISCPARSAVSSPEKAFCSRDCFSSAKTISFFSYTSES